MYIIYKIFSYGTKILFLWTFIKLLMAIFSDTSWKTVGILFAISLVSWFITEQLYKKHGDDGDVF